MKFNFIGKKALVTGGSRGIGASIAKNLSSFGCEVHVASRSAEKLKVDLTDESQVCHLVEEVQELAPDILVNCAGVTIPGDISEVTPLQWAATLKLNLEVPFRLTQAVQKNMKAKGWGRILNVSSIAALKSRGKSSAYSSSKAGLLGLTRATSLDLGSFGILVNALCPGYTQTEMLNGLSEVLKNDLLKRVPLGRFAAVEDISSFAVFLVSDLNTYITGQSLVIDGGVTAQ